jgi:3-dehydroquinate dehydratase
MLGLREPAIYGTRTYTGLLAFIESAAREAYRQVSYASEACRMTIAGKGFEGYREAINYLLG